jgi:hypothetical protein
MCRAYGAAILFLAFFPVLTHWANLRRAYGACEPKACSVIGIKLWLRWSWRRSGLARALKAPVAALA